MDLYIWRKARTITLPMNSTLCGITTKINGKQLLIYSLSWIQDNDNWQEKDQLEEKWFLDILLLKHLLNTHLFSHFFVVALYYLSYFFLSLPLSIKQKFRCTKNHFCYWNKERELQKGVSGKVVLVRGEHHLLIQFLYLY